MLAQRFPVAGIVLPDTWTTTSRYPYAPLSQENVAYAAGITRYTFQKFEKGESMPGTPSNPSLRNIMAIAQVLEVSLDELVPLDWPDLRA